MSSASMSSHGAVIQSSVAIVKPTMTLSSLTSVDATKKGAAFYSGDALDAALEPEGSPKQRWWSLRWHLLDPDRFVTSYIVSPKWLLAFRALVFLYMTAVVIGQIVQNQFEDGSSLKYITWLSFLTTYIYFGAATVHSAVYIVKGRPALMHWQHRYLNRLIWLMYELESTFEMMVPIVYWSVLAADAPQANTDPVGFWINISVHGLTGLFVVIEIVLGRNIVVLSHIFFMFGASLCYLVYAWIWRAAGAELPYFFLTIWWYYLMLPAFFGLMYIFMYFVHLGKEKAFAKKHLNSVAPADHVSGAV